jgi:chromosome partitioning protein
VVKIIPFFNQAGGCSKTTLVQNVGYHLGERGNRVLLVDLDPQASLTSFCGLDPATLEKTLYNSLSKEEPLPIHSDLDGFDLVSSNILLAECEQELVLALKREERLKDVLAPVRRKYDFILIDCPPSLGLLSLIALVTGTHVLVPIQTHYKAFIGTGSLLKTVKMVQTRLNKSLKVAGFVPTLHEETKLNRAVLAAIHEQLASVAPILPPLPKAIALAEASEKGVPLAKHSRAKKTQHLLDWFDKLAYELEEL